MEQEHATKRTIDPAETRILVIDNDTRRRSDAERFLADEGFAITAVGEGFSALRAAAINHFALAIISLDLPGWLDGVTTLRHLRTRQPAIRGLFTGDATVWPERLDEHDNFIAASSQPHEMLGCVFELLQRHVSRLNVG